MFRFKSGTDEVVVIGNIPLKANQEKEIEMKKRKEYNVPVDTSSIEDLILKVATKFDGDGFKNGDGSVVGGFIHNTSSMQQLKEVHCSSKA